MRESYLKEQKRPPDADLGQSARRRSAAIGGKVHLGLQGYELADMLGCKKDSIRMKLTRARRRAFQLMTEEEGDKI
mgnify:CR=1 FL=1